MRLRMIHIFSFALVVGACSPEEKVSVEKPKPSIESSRQVETSEVGRMGAQVTRMANHALSETYVYVTTGKNQYWGLKETKEFGCDPVENMEFQYAHVGTISRVREMTLKEPIISLLSIVKFSCVNRGEQKHFPLYVYHRMAYDEEFNYARCNDMFELDDNEALTNGVTQKRLEDDFTKECGWINLGTCGANCDEAASYATGQARAYYRDNHKPMPEKI